MNKIILIILGYCITLSVAYGSLNKEDLINATVKINVTPTKSGSGMVILYQSKPFILTNAHVCLPQSEMLLNTQLIKKNKDKILYYTIKNQFKESQISVKFNQIKFNSYYDICIIPLPANKEFPSISYPKTKTKLATKNKYFFYNLNNPKENIQEKQLTLKNNKKLLPDLIEYIQSNKKVATRPRGEYFELDGEVFFGDSGSLLFNEKLQLVGQVFGISDDGTIIKGIVTEKKHIDYFLAKVVDSKL